MKKQVIIVIILNIIINVSYAQNVINDNVGICLRYQGAWKPSSSEAVLTGTYRCLACKEGFSLSADGFCFCPEGTFYDLVNNECDLSNSKPNCVSGIFVSGSYKCIVCGYGYKLNAGTSNCDCNGDLIQGGCSNIPFCSHISFPTPTSEFCVGCADTFILNQGRCTCESTFFDNVTKTCKKSNSSSSTSPVTTTIQGCIRAINASFCSECGYGLTLATNGTCICNHFNISGDCTNILGCNYVLYSDPQTAICVSCRATFILSQKVCICGINTFYNSTTDTCTAVLISASLAPSIADTPKNNQILSINQLFIIVVAISAVILALIVYLIYTLNKSPKIHPSSLQQEKSLSIIEAGDNINASNPKFESMNKLENEVIKQQTRIRRKKRAIKHNDETIDIQQFNMTNQDLVN